MSKKAREMAKLAQEINILVEKTPLNDLKQTTDVQIELIIPILRDLVAKLETESSYLSQVAAEFNARPWAD